MATDDNIAAQVLSLEVRKTEEECEKSAKSWKLRAIRALWGGQLYIWYENVLLVPRAGARGGGWR